MRRRLSTATRKVTSVLSRPAAGVLLYVGLAIASTWPLAMSPMTRFPLGASQSDTVPLFNIWTIWWNAEQAGQGFADYWNAPIFHPATNTFAYSEPQPLTLMVAPVIWLTGSPVLAYNVYLLLSLVLNGIVGAVTLRVLRVRRVVAMLGGAALLLLPAVHWQSDVIQLLPMWPSMWTLSALIRLSRRPRLRTGVESGLAFTVAFLSCGHHGLFLAILLSGSAWLLVRPLREWNAWLPWVLAGAVAALGVLPIALKLREVAEVRQFDRSRKSIEKLSLKLGDYTAAKGWQLVDPGTLEARANWKVSPGFAKSLIAVVGLAIGLSRRRTRRVTIFLALFGTLAFGLSLGSNLKVFGWQPWWSIAETVPGAAQVRNVYRFAFFFQMTIVLLAAMGVSSAWSLVRTASRRTSASVVGKRLASAAVVGGGLVAVCEVLPYWPGLGYAPDARPQIDWIEFVRENTPPRKAVACVPFARGNRVHDFQPTMWWMFLGTEHGVPLVNGYSGFFPQEYFSLRRQVNEEFPDEAVLRRCERAGVEFVLVATRQVASDKLLMETESSPWLELVFQGQAGVDVYRIQLPNPEDR